ncbi:hypothetical protein TSOC_013271, partial [Tetrabaena socialis]
MWTTAPTWRLPSSLRRGTAGQAQRPQRAQPAGAGSAAAAAMAAATAGAGAAAAAAAAVALQEQLARRRSTGQQVQQLQPLLPQHRLLLVAGWRVLVTHIVGAPPQTVEPEAAALIAEHRPHVVVFGHSHRHLALTAGPGVRYCNPGSAGPARFRLPRTAALLELPPGGP